VPDAQGLAATAAMQMQRCFFSLCFNSQQQQQLADLRPIAAFPQAHWHPASNLHLTLVFLGAQSEISQQELWQQAQPMLQATPAFSLQVDHLAFFSRAKVLYLGCRSLPAALEQLQSQLHQLCQPLLRGAQVEQFVPHITLARKINTLANYQQPIEPMTLVCTEAALFHSISTLSGVRYLPMQRQSFITA